jgi:hypothetical protein
MQTKLAQQSENGVGVVRINGTGLWGLWVYEFTCERYEWEPGDWRELSHTGQRWRVRLSIDDFENLNIHEYQRVRFQLPGSDEEDAYFKRRRTNPPFVWLEFGKDVRR